MKEYFDEKTLKNGTNIHNVNYSIYYRMFGNK